jgi:hypothetical protein
MKWLSLFALAFVWCIGCAPPSDTKAHRIEARLDEEGYALFRADFRNASRGAVLVEMRNAPPGTYVLLHSRKAPESVGWFALDVGAYAPCRRFGKDAVDRIEVDCVVPGGHGELVDVVTIASMRLLPAKDPALDDRAPADTTLLRHEVTCRCEARGSSSSESSAAESKETHTYGYYAVMRVEPPGSTNVVVPFAIEAVPLDEDDNDEAAISRQ